MPKKLNINVDGKQIERNVALDLVV